MSLGEEGCMWSFWLAYQKRGRDHSLRREHQNGQPGGEVMNVALDTLRCPNETAE